MKSALVVISHYNAWPTDQLVALLGQLRSVPSGYPFRCLVVVNQAVDRPLDLPPEHADVEILYRENTGYNIGAWDYGWRTGDRADYYLFLQEECKILRPDWLGAFVRRLVRPKVGLVGESMNYRGLSWDRLDYFKRFDFYPGARGEPVLGDMQGVRRFLTSKGVPVGWTGEHLQSLIIATRRDVLEAIDGFMIGASKGDAIACEFGISLAAVAKGWKLEQVGLLPFHYIDHPQWAFLVELGLTLIPMNWALRFSPLAQAEMVKNKVHGLRKILSSRLLMRLVDRMSQAARPTAEAGTGPA
jgi:hypothetical protein